MEENPYSARAKGGTKWSAMVRCFPFLEETSERDEFWWTASTSTDGANGLNCKCLAGLDVEKLSGEGTPPVGQKCRSDGSWFAKILKLHLFCGELLVQVSETFLQRKPTLWNAFERRK